MLQSEIIYNIKNLRAGGVQSDDEQLSDRQYAFIIDYYRAKLYKQDQERNKSINSVYIQNLGKVDLIMADKNECCDINSCVLRTKLQVPSPLAASKLNFTFVGLVDGQPFQEYEVNAVYWAKSSKYAGPLPKWYYQNGYIYIVNPPSNILEFVTIRGIFESPVEAKTFRTCDCGLNNEPCFKGFDFKYPIPASQLDTLVKLIIESEIKLSAMLPPDTLNDTTTKTN
jgi:hypothetical protein